MTAPPAAQSTAPANPAAGVLPRRSWAAAAVMAVLGVVALVLFGLQGEPGATSTFGVSLPGDETQLDPIVVPSRATAIVLSLLALGVAAAAAVLTARRRPARGPLVAAFGTLWILAFLVWAIAGQAISLTGLLQGTLLLAVPLVFGALSGVLCERAGVINIAIEGQLLSGAFLSAVLASLTGSLLVGLVVAPLAGVLVGWVLAAFAVRYVVDQIIVGVVLNVLVVGVTSFLYGSLLSEDQDRWNSPQVFEAIEIPLLADIPVVGPVLFDQSIVVYLMYVTVAVVHVGLFRTRWGLRVRAVGEHPTAADTVGIKVNVVRYRNVLLGGAVAGLGGAFLTLGSVGAFSKEMSGGRGFIALAAMIFGRWSPLGSLAAALLFGFAYSVQSVLGVIGTPVPSEFLLMAPYLATIFAVAGLVGRVRAPAADGVPYVKA